MDPNCFRYLNSSAEYSADGINDKEEFVAMKNAMRVCGVSESDQISLLEIVAAVLHLGNIDFIENGNNANVDDRRSLEFPAYLMGVTETILLEKLSTRVVTTGGAGKRSSTYTIPLNVEQARNTRDALAKSLYSRMFDWIVLNINRAMAQLSVDLKVKDSLCIGVLDIFGFEIFDVHSSIL